MLPPRRHDSPCVCCVISQGDWVGRLGRIPNVLIHSSFAEDIHMLMLVQARHAVLQADEALHGWMALQLPYGA